jgi:hypothetical protein
MCVYSISNYLRMFIQLDGQKHFFYIQTDAAIHLQDPEDMKLV